MVAVAFADESTQQRGHGRAEVDAHVEDREAAVAAGIAPAIQRADYRGDIRLEETVAGDEQGQGGEEGDRLGHHHQELAGGHQRAAEDHGPALPQQAVGQHTAQERRHVDQGREGAVDGVGAGVVVAKEDGLAHVHDQQGPHAVEAESLPHFGEEERVQPYRMAEQGGGVGQGWIVVLAIAHGDVLIGMGKFRFYCIFASGNRAGNWPLAG